MELIIDNREKQIREYFKNFENVSFRNLDIGDIQFNLDNNIFLVIERKTIKDLISSIKSKRYFEQKIRLKSNIENNKILYLIEGSLDNYGKRIDGVSKEVVTSIYLSLLLKDNIKIYQTNNIDKTIKFILKIYNKLTNNPKKLIKKDNKNNTKEAMCEYSKYINAKKKKNLTPDVCYLTQLTQIPGISNLISKSIFKKYPNILSFYSNYENNQELLKGLEYEISNGKKRKVSKKKSIDIHKFLFKDNNPNDIL